MDEQQKRKIRNIINIISVLLMLSIIGVLIFMLVVNKTMNPMVFNTAIIIVLVMYWVLTDIIEPRLLHEFDGITSDQMRAYFMYVGADALGYAGLVYFAFNLGKEGNSGIVGAVIYFIGISARRKFKEQFRGKVTEVQGEAVEEEQTEPLGDEQGLSAPKDGNERV